MDALLFDLDGVLYVGDSPVAQAAETVAWCQDAGIPHLFLTNTTSRPRSALVEKLARFDIHTDQDHILTPPLAAFGYLSANVTGPVALFVPEITRTEFAGLGLLPEDAETGAAAVVMGDLGTQWGFATLNRAFRLLMAEPHPQLIALGMTRYWRGPDGLRLDTGAFVSALRYATGIEPVVMGKPAQPFYAAALQRLGADPARTVMIGDDIRGDIEGAQSAGIHALLVRTGKFKPADLELGITPDAVLDSVADLPAWWSAHSA